MQWVGEYQHQLVYHVKIFCTYIECKVKHIWGYRNIWLKWVGHLWLKWVGYLYSNGWDSYGKVGIVLGDMLKTVFRGVLVIVWPRVSVPLNSQLVAYYKCLDNCISEAFRYHELQFRLNIMCIAWVFPKNCLSREDTCKHGTLLPNLSSLRESSHQTLQFGIQKHVREN